jgi:arsenate reductase
MAEALLRHHGGDRFEVHSAGTEPKGVNPLTLRALRAVDIDASGAQSKSVMEFLGQPFDYVVTVCDRARETCPYFPGSGERLHWGFEDPAGATGSENQRLAIFERVRDEIDARVGEFAARVGTGTGRGATA